MYVLVFHTPRLSLGFFLFSQCVNLRAHRNSHFMSVFQRIFGLALLTVLTVTMGGCRFWDNSMTFFNTYYNQKKLMQETEDEFGYNDYIKPPKPRVIAPQESDIVLDKNSGELPKYVQDMIIKPVKLQPVQIKVDSIIIKGSKILATHPKSSFVDGTMFLMAKAFFYRSEWLPSNIKCLEIAEQFPNSSYSPDAHLLSSKNYLIQRNMPKAKTMLSRTIDVAWQQERYDVLSEAFELLAEVAIEEEDFDAAERPYRQAISQSDDDGLKAKWQTDLGLVLYRLRNFAKAEKELGKVSDYAPSVLNEFEAKYYRTLSLIELKRFDEASEIIAKLEKNRNFDEYAKLGYLNAAKLNYLRLKNDQDSLATVERSLDSSSSGSIPILVANFERGLEYFRKKDYDNARRYFAKAKVVRSPVFDGANNLYNLLNVREQKLVESEHLYAAINNADSSKNKDSIRSAYAKTIFDVARTHEQLGNKDSAEHYFEVAANNAPDSDTLKAQYLFSSARMVKARNNNASDSLLEIVFNRYRSTAYGDFARKELGFTDYAVLDSVEEVYRSASRFRAVNDFPMALKQYGRVSEEYRNSKFAPASLYAMGWIWEQKLRNNDSALYYYAQLMKRYPFSEYSDDIHYAVAYSNAKNGIGDTNNLPWGSRQKPNELQKNGNSTAPSTAPSTNPANGQSSDPTKNFSIPPSSRPTIPDVNLNPTLINSPTPPTDSSQKPPIQPESKTNTPSDSTQKKPK